MTAKVSPLAPREFIAMPAINGVEITTGASQTRYKQRDDIALFKFAKGTRVAGVFTRSKTASASVVYGQQSLAAFGHDARALFVNAGNANAFTGARGERDVESLCRVLAAHVNCAAEQVFTSSTGVIGEPMPIEQQLQTVDSIAQNWHHDSASWQRAANAIMTTDTFAKGATRSTQIAGKKVTINGIAKGSGMIAPDMATMLGYIVTDANLPKDILQQCLKHYNQVTFNAITVDSDTSTSDTCLLFATGCADNARPESIDAPEIADFKQALHDVMQDLALQIVKDGEGATKLVQIDVDGAENDQAARNIAMSIANSPLVKTAIAGEDPNWGRIVMAVGKSGEMALRDQLQIKIGGVPITYAGQRIESYDESVVKQHMQQKNIDIQVSLGIGNGAFRVWTCDLTYDYIRINADYRS